MRLAELQGILRDVDPAAVLVAPRVLDRVIQHVLAISHVVWQVPHRDGFVVERSVLFQHVDPDDLILDQETPLPSKVILLAYPTADQLGPGGEGDLLLRYWRRLFHASIHLTLERACEDGRLTLSDIRARIDQLGRTEFDEIRSVLIQDGYLPTSADERASFLEFAAVWLEHRFFSKSLLPTLFPGIRQPERVNRLLDRDLDAEAIFERTRLRGAKDPVDVTDKSSDEAHDYFWNLMRSADRAREANNDVRAAILRTKAARVAPGQHTASTQEKAREDLRKLVARLEAALKLDEASREAWFHCLLPLLDKADQGRRPEEALLLFDLQKVCVDHERDVFALDVVEWMLSAGKRPIQRPLPSQRIVRLTMHLRVAFQRLTLARLADEDRRKLRVLMTAALEACEERLRARFRPILVDSFHDVGLTPTNPPEHAAFDKMIEELLDRISTHGFLTFSDLRDALSRNQLKLPDLASPQEFLRGDPLLRLDRRLNNMLDGVYRRGEIYMRLLEALTALLFGTFLGRLLTRFVLVPFVSAFLLVETVLIVLEKLHVVQPAVEPGSGPPPPGWLLPDWFRPAAVVGVGFFLLGMIHWPRFRQACLRAAARAARPIRYVLVDLPLRLVRVDWLRRLVSSWSFQLSYSFLLLPLAVCLVVWQLAPEAFSTHLHGVSTFLAANFLINSRFGTAIVELTTRGYAWMVHALRAGLIPALYHFTVQVFKEIVGAVEYLLFFVDESLHYRSGESRLALVSRTILGMIWTPISFVARFYFVVLIEPGFNPIKFPICCVAAKVIYPLWPYLQPWFADPLAPILGTTFANLFAAATIWLLPDAFGFLFWETKENWSLYRANRGEALRAIPIGSHGETLSTLLRPGFHSGTVPRLFRRLRQREREAHGSGSWRQARSVRQALDDVELAVKNFVEREFVSLLARSTSWRGERLGVGRVALATNRIRVELLHAGQPDRPLAVEFEERSGWLVASIAAPGWLDCLDDQQRLAFVSGLAALYKLAGVDFVREQVRAALPGDIPFYDLTFEGLILWRDHRHGEALYLNLRNVEGEFVLPQRPNDAKDSLNAVPTSTTENGFNHDQVEGAIVAEHLIFSQLDMRRLVFARWPLRWETWVEGWKHDQAGRGHPPLEHEGIDLVLLPEGVAGSRAEIALPTVDPSSLTPSSSHSTEARAG